VLRGGRGELEEAAEESERYPEACGEVI